MEGDEERNDKEDVLIGTNVDIDIVIALLSSLLALLPSIYTLQPGGSAAANVINFDNARISKYGYIRLSTHKDHSKTPSGTSARRYLRLAAQPSMHSATV